MAYIKPQAPIRDASGTNRIYPLTTADQVQLDGGKRLNAKLDDLEAEITAINNKFGGCYIAFVDDQGNPTTEPWIHWDE